MLGPGRVCFWEFMGFSGDSVKIEATKIYKNGEMNGTYPLVLT